MDRIVERPFPGTSLDLLRQLLGEASNRFFAEEARGDAGIDFFIQRARLPVAIPYDQLIAVGLSLLLLGLLFLLLFRPEILTPIGAAVSEKIFGSGKVLSRNEVRNAEEGQ